MAKLYGIPVLGRVGLTHGLMAWARCQLWCRDNGAQVIAPFWFKFRIGPYLRKERDKRNYFILFKPGKAIAGLKRLYLLMVSRKKDYSSGFQLPPSRVEKVIVRFHNSITDNMSDFHILHGQSAFLRQRLIEMTRDRFLPKALLEPFIAIHVRRGDFVQNATGKMIVEGATNVMLPVEWYVDRLIALRKALGVEINAVVFSDGTDAELLPLLACSNVERSTNLQSITDLLEISSSAAVISSGSGFSIWGAFLGDVPRLCHPGQMIVEVFKNPELEIESGTSQPVPHAFVQQIFARVESFASAASTQQPT